MYTIRIIFSLLIISCATNAQNTVVNNLSLVNTTGITFQSNHGFIISGYDTLELGLNTIASNPALQSWNNVGELTNTLSLPEYERVTVIHELSSGSLSCLAEKDDDEKYYLIMVDKDLSEVTMECAISGQGNPPINDIPVIGSLNGTSYLDVLTTIGTSEERLWMFLSNDNLRGDSIWFMPRTTGKFYPGKDGTLLHVENHSTDNSTLSQYYDNLPIWEQNHPFEILDVLAHESGFIYIAGSKDSDPGHRDAVVAMLSFDGILLNEQTVQVHNNPEFWPDAELSFDKIISNIDFIQVIGTSNRDPNSASPGNHNFISGLYDYNLEEKDLSRENVTGTRGKIEDWVLNSGIITALGNASGLHLNQSYMVNIPESFSIVSTTDVDEKKLSYYPNPVISKLYLNVTLGTPLTITDFSGRIIMQTHYQEYLDVSNLVKGTYTIQALIDKKVISSMFMKQ